MNELELHIAKVDPEERWNRVQALEAPLKFVSYRDDATIAWFSASHTSGIRLAVCDGAKLDFRRVHEWPVVELRQYRIKPGMRARFAEFFRDRATPAQARYDITVLGHFDDLGDANNFVWMRGFPSLVERDRRKSVFYTSRLWYDELQDDAFGMIEDYSNVLLAAPVRGEKALAMRVASVPRPAKRGEGGRRPGEGP